MGSYMDGCETTTELCECIFNQGSTCLQMGRTDQVPITLSHAVAAPDTPYYMPWLLPSQLVTRSVCSYHNLDPCYSHPKLYTPTPVLLCTLTAQTVYRSMLSSEVNFP